MALLSSLLKASDLARLSEHQRDVLASALAAEILSNAAVRKAVTSKIQGLHKELIAGEKKLAK